MAEKRKIRKMTLVLALALTILIFIGGIAIGNALTQSKVNDILSSEQETQIQLENLQLEQDFLKDYPCQSPTLLSESLEELGVKLTYLESQYSKDDPRIIALKNPYTLLEVRHYLALKSMTQRCGQNYTLMLFFYSNDPANAKTSEEQGFVLDYLRKKFDNIKVYSIDSDLDLGIVNVMKNEYSVSVTPSLVIGDKTYVGFHSKEELESLLENKTA